MTGNKKITAAAIIIVAAISALTGLTGPAATVFAQTTPNWNLPNINPDTFLNSLPAPISDFVNSAKQISNNLYSKSHNLNGNSLNPTGVFDSINNWFIGVTGISLVSILQAIGNLIIWVLSFATQLIRWLLSLVK
jgi:hypothetical protein